MGLGTSKEVMKGIGRLAVQQPEEIRERRTAGEEYLGELRAGIGAPGTYDLPPAAGGPPPTVTPSAPTAPPPDDKLTRDGLIFTKPNQVKKYDKLIKKGYTREQAKAMLPDAQESDSIFKREVTGAPGVGGGGGKSGQTTLQLDKDKALEQVRGSSAYRQVSRMMAESEQLLARQGPLWDEMIKNTQLPIIEGASAAARENAEEIRRAMGRGGAARRDAYAAIQKMRTQNDINMKKGQALAQARMQLDVWARENAKNIIKFADDWSANTAGVRESYMQAMDMAADLMASKSLPMMFMAQQKAQEYRAQQSQQNRNKVYGHIANVLGIASSIVGMANGIPISYKPTQTTQSSSTTSTETSDGRTIENTPSVSGTYEGDEKTTSLTQYALEKIGL